MLQLAALLAAVGLLAELAARYYGDAGALVVVALTGLADVDAVTLTVPTLLAEHLSVVTGGAVVATAVASNGLAKTAYAVALGNAGFRLRYCAGTLGGLAAMGLALGLAA